ncbi:MAG TPA: hypothetical protein VFW76_06585 [Ktedonobacterales bacterium]|nr:hypothetical protein [Ktedonobacterales bacterium]
MNDRPTATITPTRRNAPQWLPLALGVAAGILLVILGIALFSRLTATPTPTNSPAVAPVAHQICGDLTTQQYDDLYGLLATSEQALGTRDQFVASQRQLDAQLGTAHACSYTVAGQDASSATLTLTLARGTLMATTAQVKLTLEQNHWRIADYDSSLVAIPGYTA